MHSKFLTNSGPFMIKNSPESGYEGYIPQRATNLWQPTPVFLPGKFHGQRSRQATVHWVTKRRTQLNNCVQSHLNILE